MIGAQEKKIRRIMIAAPKSGSGKTMITCGLLQIFKENGVVYFPSGFTPPWYI